MPLPPLRFEPLLKSRAWGGRSLAALGKQLPPAGAIGESWELADLAPPVADGVSRVSEGPFRGRSISELLGSHRAAILGRTHADGPADGRFPLLVKYLDATAHLSVQVHPTARYAAAHPGAHLKTEAWVVVAAAPGAAVFRGIRPEVTPDAFRRAIADGSAVDLLVREPVTAGDCIPLESGLCHALGAGVLVAEVQTASDTTFRVFDWNRNDPARPLHVEQAMECILFGADQRLAERPVTSLDRMGAPWSDGLRAATLCANEFFEIEGIEASPSGDAAPMDCVTDGSAVVLMLTRGEAIIETAGHRAMHLSAGDTLLLPADLVPTTIDLAPSAFLVRSSLADPARRIRDGARPGERVT